MKLTEDERELLDRVRGRLADAGLSVSDDGVIRSLLRVLVKVPARELAGLLKDALRHSGEAGK